MKTITKLTLATSYLAVALSGTEALANAAPAAPAANCCDELSSRIKKLEDKAVMSDTKKIMLSGFINRAALYLNNGNRSNIAHVNNENADSRLNVTGVANFNEDMVFGATFETAFKQNTSGENEVRVADNNDTSERRFSIRKSELFVDSKKFGKLSMGRGSMASDDTMEETDLSGTRVVANGASVWQMAGGASFFDRINNQNGIFFVQADDESNFDGVFNDVDGLSRRDRVRYDTPKYYGFSLSTSHAYQNVGNAFDVAARFAGKFMGVKVAADLAYAVDQTNNAVNLDLKFKQINGSIGVLFPVSMSKKEDTGINLFFAGAGRNWHAPGQRNGNYFHGKIGYVDSYFSIGNTAIAVDYAHTKNMIRAAVDGGGALDLAVDNKGSSWGVALVQNIDAVATEVYAGYRNYEAKRTNSALRFKDIHAVMAGARVKL